MAVSTPSALSVASAVFAGGTVAGILAWLSDAQNVAVLSVFGGIIAYAVAWLISAYRRISHARREEFVAWEKATQGTLTRQLDELTQTVGHLRKNLHAVRDEANDHAVAAQGLRSDLQMANSLNLELTRELAEANRRIMELTAELHSVGERTDKNTRRIERVAKTIGNSGVLPTIMDSEMGK